MNSHHIYMTRRVICSTVRQSRKRHPKFSEISLLGGMTEKQLCLTSVSVSDFRCDIIPLFCCFQLKLSLKVLHFFLQKNDIMEGFLWNKQWDIMLATSWFLRWLMWLCISYGPVLVSVIFYDRFIGTWNWPIINHYWIK